MKWVYQFPRNADGSWRSHDEILNAVAEGDVIPPRPADG